MLLKLEGSLEITSLAFSKVRSESVLEPHGAFLKRKVFCGQISLGSGAYLHLEGP
jgi:hypothetical protein